MRVYDNLSDLELENRQLANEIVNELDVDPENSWIHVFNSLEDFAEYEVTEGWYSAYLGDLGVGDFNGAPILFDYIDYVKLGDALANTWDTTTHLLTSDGKVIEVC